MAIQFMDNFRQYGGDTSKMLDGLPWGSLYAGLANDPDAGATGKVLQVENWAILALPNPSQQIGVGQRLWMPSLPATSRQPEFVYVNGSTALYTYIVATNGALELRRGDRTGPLVATTTVPVLAPNSWFHLELFVNTNTGAYEARIEGVTVLSGTDPSGSRPTSPVTIVQWASQGISITFYIKDFIVWDKTGSVNNDFIGTVTIYNLPVNSDVSSGWTKSSGTSDYQLLDEGDGTPVNDADFISAGFGPFPAPSIMGMTDLPATVVTVKAVQTMVRAKKSDGGDGTLVVSLKSGASTANGSAKALTTASKYWFDVQQFDPATGALWSPLAVNSAQLQLNRTL